MSRYCLFLTLLFGSSLVISCGSGSSTSSIEIDGSSTVYPITEAVAEEYRTEAPDVRVTVGVSGTGGGFQKFLRGETAINDASRAISESEIEAAAVNDIAYVQLSVAYDGLAVIVNPGNDWVDYFTVDELKRIWEPEAQGTITRWNQIRPEWPDEEIHLYGPGVASGTYDYFTEAIVGESGSSRGDFTASEDDNVLVQGVSTDVNAIGFFGLAYYEENIDRLKLVGVDNGEGPVKPSIATVSDGSYEPLSRPLFLYVSGNAVQREEVRDFINFYLEMAPSLSESVGYVALPQSFYDQDRARFQAFVEEHATGTE